MSATPIETQTDVRAHYSADAGVTGWAYGIPLPKFNAQTGKVRHWLVVPGSDHGTTLYPTEDAARTSMRDQDAILREIALRVGGPEYAPLEETYSVRLVRTVWRYGRNWFEIVDPAQDDGKRVCRVCERRVGVNPLTGGLRHHEISREKHETVWPGMPYLDGQCSGTGSKGSDLTSPEEG
jgi:hypothetical protein